MAELNSIFNKNENESVIDYDNRINLADYQHIGYAFFECTNYNLSNHSYSLYIVWNQKVNSILEDPLPQVGFSIKCSENTAKQLSFETEGQPVFAKFISTNGIINAKNIIIRFFDRNYVVTYTGSNAKAPDDVIFRATPTVNADKYQTVLSNNNGISVNVNNVNKSSFNISSYNISNFKNSSFYQKFVLNNSSFNMGSYRAGSFALGSYRKENNIGSFNLGSFNLNSFNLGSFNLGSFNLGSYNLNSFNLGSFNLGSFNLNSFNLGSFNLGSYNLNSFNLGSFNLGSFNLNSFNSGSFNLTSFNLGSFRSFAGSYNVISDREFYNKISGVNDSYPYESLLKEIFGIGYMGYGLNLI